MNRLPAVFLPPGLRATMLVLGFALGLTACQTLPPAPSASTQFTLPAVGDAVGQVQVVTAKHEDTLPDIARRFNLGFEEIVAANPGVSTWLPGEGKRIVLPTQFVLPDAPREGIVINLAAMRLFYYPKPASGEPPTVITHPVGIGREGWVTPLGATKVVKKVEAPVWYPPDSIRREHAAEGDPLPARVPPGPNNPLGTHLLRLGWPRYLIHGTDKPYSIGIRATHGCVRLYPEDIAALYEQVPLGTPVRVVNQPFLIGWQDNRLYLDAHQPLEDDKRNWNKKLRALLKSASKETGGREIDWDKATRAANGGWGVPAPILVGDPTVEEIVANAPVVANVAPTGSHYRLEPQRSPHSGGQPFSRLIAEFLGK